MTASYRRLLLIGDIHGDLPTLRAAFSRAEEEGCQALIQLGDFGWWPHTDWGFRFVEQVKKLVAEFGLPLYFIDGNHDNHPDLWAAHESVTAEGFHQISERFFYIPRGLRWQWSGVGFLAVGGGYSIDVALRTPGFSWWPTELLSEEEILKAIDPSGVPVDVVLTHEAPEGVNLGISMFPIPLAERSRKDVRRIVDHVKPTRLYHGHYHVRNDAYYFNPHTGLRVESIGLAHEGDPDGNLIVLDLGEFAEHKASLS